jgi:ParB-like chromosome segregation protein Spo0J
MDDAHALIVRPVHDGYEIISGHHRKLAAILAGLHEVPCWVREMSDEAAYMALALHNAQGELHPLEVGLHALRSGLSVREYAKRSGMSATSLAYQREAAEVFTYVNSPVDVQEKHHHLAEIHAGPRWLWQALVGVLLEHHWTVESTGKVVAPLSKLEDLPSWANADMVAEALLAGTMPPSDVGRSHKERR